MASESAYDTLIDLLDERGAKYRVIEHEPEGVTAVVSRLRGDDPGQAAKCIVVMVKVGKKARRYAAAVVPGDRRFDSPERAGYVTRRGLDWRPSAICLARPRRRHRPLGRPHRQPTGR